MTLGRNLLGQPVWNNLGMDRTGSGISMGKPEARNL